ncbi:ribonuclease E inhibitor RraB [Thalassotalea ponticola]|uniref:ribonuclease E inhibitor RraB n=1 Tax=Thalassotalea ponticola TaxID=1523392 RepID=UPI0025B45F79|nr:ribonuclease E inhibitor RraB [Thalassotalea ponticola]MDN3653350.1 ribonuclease E inhibitor RraB [Thalassotalea ponticola]
MSYPNDEHGQVLAEMEQAGIDLSQPIRVEYFQLFEQEVNAKAFAESVQQGELEAEVSVHPDQTPGVWDVDCTITMIPSYDNIVAMEQKFEQMAAKYDGYNDGWGVHFDG